MVRLLCAAIIISKLTYFVDSQRLDFKMELAMNAIKLCKWTGISSSLPTFAHQSGTGAFNTRRTLFCWSMLKLSSSGQNTYTFFSVSTCDYDLTLKNSRLITPIHQFFEFIAKRHPYTRILLKSPAKESHSFVAFGFGLGCQVSSNRMFEVWLGMNVVNDISMNSFFWHIWRYLPVTSWCLVSHLDFLLVLLSHFTPLRIYKIYITPPPKKKNIHTQNTKHTTLSGSPNNLSALTVVFSSRLALLCFACFMVAPRNGQPSHSRHSAQLFPTIFLYV